MASTVAMSVAAFCGDVKIHVVPQRYDWTGRSFRRPRCLSFFFFIIPFSFLPCSFFFIIPLERISPLRIPMNDLFFFLLIIMPFLDRPSSLLQQLHELAWITAQSSLSSVTQHQWIKVVVHAMEAHVVKIAWGWQASSRGWGLAQKRYITLCQKVHSSVSRVNSSPKHHRHWRTLSRVLNRLMVGLSICVASKSNDLYVHG